MITNKQSSPLAALDGIRVAARRTAKHSEFYVRSVNALHIYIFTVIGIAHLVLRRFHSVRNVLNTFIHTHVYLSSSMSHSIFFFFSNTSTEVCSRFAAPLTSVNVIICEVRGFGGAFCAQKPKICRGLPPTPRPHPTGRKKSISL